MWYIPVYNVTVTDGKDTYTYAVEGRTKEAAMDRALTYFACDGYGNGEVVKITER